MKKFLRVKSPLFSADVPEKLDIPILAAAAMRAAAIRRKRMAVRLVFPVFTAGAAVAAAAAVMTFSPIFSIPANPVTEEQFPEGTIAVSGNVSDESHTFSSKELLALADTTILEQENFNLASMQESAFDSDSFII